jgi:Fur family ferric uptake transcriptional regulator
MGRTTEDRLRRAGERVTAQRLAVADALEAAGRQVTAGELVERLRRRPGIGRATVFRSLEALVAAGAARRMELDGHVYGYVSCRSGHHHHLACRGCGQVDEIGETYVAAVARRIERDRGFRIDDARLDFYGLCARCARASEEPAPVGA